ncbi:beta-ketoacyl synthase N-terminal-like domain-containing protein [Kitasatospora sp. NPDC097643]|uniref:beta-ketoacyl synthase N-terminal-like domain-containing protein n=1 Tax=Kitasatospora sp. NPDC097643 TaxID=3157230 RepID=UPI00331829A8
MSRTEIHRDRPLITAWSAVSPFGIGRDAFAAGAGGARPAPADGRPVRLVPDFEVRTVLGKAGTRTFDRATGLAVTAVRELLGEAEADQCPVPTGTGTALVLGTTLGSAHSAAEFSRASFEGDKPYDVPAQLMPNVLMNGPAAATAIRFDLRGPNTTLAGGPAGGLLALGYARRLLAAGRAERALVGAVEEHSPTRTWLAGDTPDTVPGEGGAVLLLETARTLPPGRRVLAELLALDVRLDVEDDPAATLTAVVREALGQAGAEAAEVWAADVSGVTGPDGRRARAALAAVVGAEALSRITAADLVGDTASAATVFSLTTALALAEGDPSAAGRLAVITSLDEHGLAACAVLRLTGGAR